MEGPIIQLQVSPKRTNERTNERTNKPTNPMKRQFFHFFNISRVRMRESPEFCVEDHHHHHHHHHQKPTGGMDRNACESFFWMEDTTNEIMIIKTLILIRTDYENDQSKPQRVMLCFCMYSYSNSYVDPFERDLRVVNSILPRTHLAKKEITGTEKVSDIDFRTTDDSFVYGTTTRNS